MCTYTHPQSHTHSRFPVVGQIGTSRLVQNKSLNFSPSQPLPSHPPSVSHFHPLARFPASESLLMLILITPHLQADKKSKWLISSNTPESAHLLLYPSLPAFFQSNSQVPPEKCEPEIFIFLFSSSLSALHSEYYVENKIWIFNPCSPGPHKTYSLCACLISALTLHLACHAPIILAFLLFLRCAEVFYYRTFALLFLLHEYISLT